MPTCINERKVQKFNTVQKFYSYIVYMVSSIKVFSFLHNCKASFVQNKHISLNGTVSIVHFNKQPKYILDICSRIVCRMNNNHFTFYDFKMYIIIHYLTHSKLNWRDINFNDVKLVSNSCSKERYEKDNTFINELLVKINLTLSDLYVVNSNGTNIMYDLVKTKKVSPIFYLMKYHKPEEFFNNAKFDLSDDLILINKRTEQIKNNIKELKK